MSAGTSCHFGHLLQFSQKTLRSLILYHFFHDLIHVYSPRAGATAHGGQSFDINRNVTSFICCKFKKKMSLMSDFRQFFS